MPRKRRTLRGYIPTNPVSASKVCKITGPASVGDIRQCASLCGSHFFEAGAMRFFGSRIPATDPAYADGKGGAYFVTSEKMPRSSYPRLYTVKHYNGKCSFDTIGEFQAHKTKASAIKVAKALAAKR